MYMCAGNDSKGCIARAKYAGPGLFSYGATSGSTYLGSNITTTYMAFPDGYGIIVDKGTPIYVHLDARNESLKQADESSKTIRLSPRCPGASGS